MEELQNPNPTIFQIKNIDQETMKKRKQDELNPDIEDEIDEIESNYQFYHLVYDLIKNINDPEHPLTLEQLNIVSVPQIKIDHDKKYIRVFFTPTIPNCSMSTLIGLMIKVKLINSVSNNYKVILIKIQINKG